jgi:malate/lactate dehydrogenase
MTIAICQNILQDEKKVRSVSVYHSEHDVCFSVPCTISARGAVMVASFEVPDEDQRYIQDVVNLIRKNLDDFKNHIQA